MGWGDYICHGAIQNGSVDNLKKYRQAKCLICYDPCHVAVQYGSLEMLQRFLQQGYKPKE